MPRSDYLKNKDCVCSPPCWGFAFEKLIIFFVRILSWSFLVFLCSSVSLKACSPSHPAEDILSSWKGTCNHPLCGTIYAFSEEKTYSAQTPSRRSDTKCNEITDLLHKIQKAASHGSVLLLGEIHDNAEHHKFRAKFIEPPVVVMEQFNLDQQAALDEASKNTSSLPPHDRRKTFLSLLKWDTSPWAQYDYDDLWGAILTRGNISVRAGDPPPHYIKRSSKYGAAALTTLDLERLGLSYVMEDNVLQSLREDIKEAHCGMLPETILGNMAFAQRYRDATLADQTLKAVDRYGSSLVLAGNDHVRRDRGIPWYFRKRIPSLASVTVILIEVKDDLLTAKDYSLRDKDHISRADYFVFTPPAHRDDPCQAFGKNFKTGK